MNQLNATGFLGANPEVLNKTFAKVLSLFCYCHDQVKVNRALTGVADEEWIRNVFVGKYLRIHKVHFALGYLVFEAEPLEMHSSTSKTIGYIDIKITNLFGPAAYVDENQYFAFECKRINSHTEKYLKSHYIEDGLERFIHGKYAAQMNIAGMIGFVEDKKVAYDKLIDNLNTVLQRDFRASTTKELMRNTQFENHHCYTSHHVRSANASALEVGHMFFDTTDAQG